MALSTSVRSAVSQMMLEQAAPQARIAPRPPMMTPSAAILAPTQLLQVHRTKMIAQTAHLVPGVALAQQYLQALALMALTARKGRYSAMSMAAQLEKLLREQPVPRGTALIALSALSAGKARRRLPFATMKATSAHLAQQRESTAMSALMSTRPPPCQVALAVARLAPLAAIALALEAK